MFLDTESLVFMKNLGISFGRDREKKCVRPVNGIFNARRRLVNMGLVPGPRRYWESLRSVSECPRGMLREFTTDRGGESAP